jgi:hypothetical protein
VTKIISFSLWGQDPKYTVGAIRNSELSKEIYPGWECHFYIGDGVPRDVIDTLSHDNPVVIMDGSGWNATFWRFLSAEKADVFISRDTDSRLNPREKAAVNEWLASDKDFHIMRDHPYHKTEILAGMWGCRNGILKGIRDMIFNYDMGSYDQTYQNDQNFLRDVIYPIVKDNSMVHDEFFEKKPFPTPRINSQDFVGQVYDENEVTQF